MGLSSRVGSYKLGARLQVLRFGSEMAEAVLRGERPRSLQISYWPFEGALEV